MKPTHRSMLLLTAVISLGSSACKKNAQDENTRESKPNVVSEYVRSPIEKANAARDSVAVRNRMLEEAAKD